MTPIELKQWQTRLGLSELAMAHYLGVPVPTLTKWLNGTRAPDSATQRLFAVMQRLERESPVLHGELMREARQDAPESPTRGRGRPRKGTGATQAENAPPAPESAPAEIPDWLSSAV